MISIMQSIKKKYVDLILSGKKKVEIRKTGPRYNEGEDTVYKVFIYETKANGGCGKVIGHYYSRVKRFDSAFSEWAWSVAPAGATMPMSEDEAWRLATKEGCVTEDELRAYLKSYEGDYKLVFFHIFDLEVYDKPKSLNRFTRASIDLSKPSASAVCPMYGRKPLTRAPQSWCYVEEKDGR